MDTQTTEKDLQWFYTNDDEAIGPPPDMKASDRTKSNGIDPAQLNKERETDSRAESYCSYSNISDKAQTLTDEVQEGEFTEEIEGEVIEDPPKLKGVPLKWLIPIGAGALAVALVLLLIVVPFFQESASVIITPDRQSLSISSTLTTQTRQLFSKSLTLSQVVKTTGTAHQNASVAQGYLTFYNALPSYQTIPAGTMIAGNDGVSVVTDADANIPPGTLATNGAVTVYAHTASIGAGANIPAGDINGACCREYVLVKNSQFAGGADARNYQTPTNTDIQTASQQMSTTLQESMSMEAQKQLQPGEAVLPPKCTNTTSSSQKPGQEATQITVSLTSSCTAFAYNQTDLANKETSVFMQAVSSQLGSGYTLDGQLTTKITDMRSMGKTPNDVLQITVSLTGTTQYHFNRSEIANMQNLIAGASQAKATILLLHTRGVHTAGIQIENGKDTVPNTVRSITVSIIEKG